MADPSKTDAIKAGIIKHMNADHAESLTLYLRNYLSLPPSAAHSPRLTAISLTSLTIHASGTSHHLPLDPPLASLADSRARLVAMDRASKAALGIAPPPLVTTWTPPTAPGHVVVAALVLFYLASYALRARVVPGSLPHAALERAWPWGADGYLWLQNVIFVPVVAVHAVEAAVMAWRLRGAGVGPCSRVWWMWIASCAVEGVGAHQRFGALVRKAKKQH